MQVYKRESVSGSSQISAFLCLKELNSSLWFFTFSVAGHSSIPASCSSDHKPESVAAAAAASTEVEDFAQLAEQLQLDQISKDGNGTETFQV